MFLSSGQRTHQNQDWYTCFHSCSCMYLNISDCNAFIVWNIQLKTDITASTSDEDEPFPRDSLSNATSIFHLLPSTSRSEWGHIPLTSGHYYPVIMCSSAWLHLLFLVDSLMWEESNFTWWMIIREGEAISASCLASELCTTKSHRCPNWLPALPAFSNILPLDVLYTLGYYCQSCEDFLTCQNVHEVYLLPQYLPVLLNQMSVLTLPLCYEKTKLTYFPAAKVGRLIHWSQTIHDQKSIDTAPLAHTLSVGSNRDNVSKWASSILSLYMQSIVLPHQPNASEYQPPSPHTRLNISINIRLEAKDVQKQQQKKARQN